MKTILLFILLLMGAITWGEPLPSEHVPDCAPTAHDCLEAYYRGVNYEYLDE